MRLVTLEKYLVLNGKRRLTPWRFTVNRVVANTGHEAVSDVTVTDGTLTARAVSFFSAEAGKIAKIVEYWPEPYAAPVNRAHLVEPID